MTQQADLSSVTHGLVNTYVHHGCRCEKCRRANAERTRRLRRKRKDYEVDQIPHGVNGYRNYSCRCDTCKAASAAQLQAEISQRAGQPDRIPHGTRSGFRFWNCRCESCADANRVVGRARARRVQTEIRDEAWRNGYQWTGPELEIIERSDLTTREKALMIGRTYMAVRHMMRLLRDEPTGKHRRVLGTQEKPSNRASALPHKASKTDRLPTATPEHPV